MQLANIVAESQHSSGAPRGPSLDLQELSGAPRGPSLDRHKEPEDKFCRWVNWRKWRRWRRRKIPVQLVAAELAEVAAGYLAAGYPCRCPCHPCRQSLPHRGWVKLHSLLELETMCAGTQRRQRSGVATCSRGPLLPMPCTDGSAKNLPHGGIPWGREIIRSVIVQL